MIGTNGRVLLWLGPSHSLSHSIEGSRRTHGEILRLALMGPQALSRSNLIPGAAASGLKQGLRDISFIAWQIEEDQERIQTVASFVVHGDLGGGDKLITTSTAALWLPGTASRRRRVAASRLFLQSDPSPTRRGLYQAASEGAWLATEPAWPLSELTSALEIGHDESSPAVIRRTPSGPLVRERWAHPLQVFDLCRHHGSFKARPGGPWIAHAMAPSTVGLDDGGSLDEWPVVGVGVAGGRAPAESRARGEALERYLLSHPESGTRRYARALDLAEDWIHPDRAQWLTPPQKERLVLEDFKPEEPEWWVRGYTAEGPETTQKPCWIPAALVFLSGPKPPWLLPGAPNTSGCASASSERDAIRRAWLELVERDAFVRAWYGEEAFPIDETSLPRSIAAPLKRIRGLEDVRDAILLQLQGYRGTPVFLAIATGEAFGLAIGSSAGSPEAAAEKAMSECASQVMFPFPPVTRPDQVLTPAQHGGWSRAPAVMETAARLFNRGALTPFPFVKPDTNILGRHTAVVLTLPEAAGTYAARVMSTELVPLHFGYDAEPIAHPNFPESHRVRHRPLLPHPFA